jgi:tRNA uridine 5-carboxymethylaminomethyl modification enzyme
VSDERWERFQKKQEGLEAIQELIKAGKITREKLALASQLAEGNELVSANQLSEANELAAASELSEDLAALKSWPGEWVERVFLDIKYSGYIEKEKRAAAKLSKMDAVKISPEMDYASLTGLSAEAKEKLKTVRPLTLGQAARIPGIRQGDIALLMIASRKKQEKP